MRNRSRSSRASAACRSLERELPFGESLRSTKKTLYRIKDPAIRFWFRVYSPHRTFWSTYSREHKQRLVHEHAATVFEGLCRARLPGARRHWGGGVEIDLVAPDPEARTRLLVAEVTWPRLSKGERAVVRRQLEAKWARCALSRNHPQVRFEVFDATLLGR